MMLQLVQDVTITYESVLTSVGEFGRYQKFVCLVLCMTHINMAVQLIGSVFTLAVPEHRSVIACLLHAWLATVSVCVWGGGGGGGVCVCVGRRGRSVCVCVCVCGCVGG